MLLERPRQIGEESLCFQGALNSAFREQNSLAFKEP